MTDIPPEFNPETAPPALNIDWDAYLPFFEDEDISDEHKRELIEALWSIMVSFVDLGFGIHPVQQARAQQIGGKDVSLAEMLAMDVLNSPDTRTVFEHAAADKTGAQQEGSL
ncbi:hypothetical protein [Halocynthiibacter styelae]|uniref:Uncharacterized protein n=1 Tax=Halocynthiibacter styelae TaxID=2761955 RepID=A0A8J7LKK7_9RHOB|nr:hypothetical protein [Paenihalocynthiibacter styelae]MBI1494210.1 hypothetical protein [Paenihalocynthiibacter styelae]